MPVWVVNSYLRLGDDQRALEVAAHTPTTDDAGLGIRLFGSQGANARRLPEFLKAAQALGWVDAWEPPER